MKCKEGIKKKMKIICGRDYKPKEIKRYRGGGEFQDVKTEGQVLNSGWIKESLNTEWVGTTLNPILFLPSMAGTSPSAPGCSKPMSNLALDTSHGISELSLLP